MPRLTAQSVLPDTVEPPRYAPEQHGAGIVHLGLGAFHRAHQAVYTDAALAAAGGDWRILGVSLRTPDAADALNPQDGRYCLLERGDTGTKARVIGAIQTVLFAPEQGRDLLSALVSAQTKIVSLTITEKGYCRDLSTGGLDRTEKTIAADLEATNAYPLSAIGWLVRGLQARRRAGIAPFTVLSCDNLPHNGVIARRLVLDFAAEIDPGLHDWIAEHAVFPSTMVDRITPAPTAETRALAQTLCGHEDMAAVETEPFSQWVLEDRFSAGRPHWEHGGALFVRDIAPYETMKLRMLNGTHSMLAYAGALAGKTYVRDVMADPILRAAVTRHLHAAAATVPPVPGIDLDRYAADLTTRFENRNIAHATLQIAMDGTQKLPQRIFAPTMDILAGHQADLIPFAFAIACWMAFAARNANTLSDPRAPEIRQALQTADTAPAITQALTKLPGLLPPPLAASDPWLQAITTSLDSILTRGVIATLQG